MKSAAITLRLSVELAKNLGRIAKGRGIPKSQLVREAVARYLAPSGSEARVPRINASSLAARWKDVPRLTPDEAFNFHNDIEAARAHLPPQASAWE